MIEMTVENILAVAAAQTSLTTTVAAITPMLTTMRQSLEAMRFDTTPRICTYEPCPVAAGESTAMTVGRVLHRINDLHCARAFGTPDDVRHVIEETVAEVRAAAIRRPIRVKLPIVVTVKRLQPEPTGPAS